MNQPRIVVYEDRSKTRQRWRYKIIGGNGEVMAQGEGFISEDHAWRSIRRLPVVVGAALAKRALRKVRG